MAEPRRPRGRRELSIPTAARIETVPRARAIIDELDTGQFGNPARLVDQMLQNARLRAMLETRLSALTGAEQRWKPRRDNRDGRRAAKDIVEDWPRMVSTPTRWQINVWGLLLGMGLGVEDWSGAVSPVTLRWVPRLIDFEPYGVWFDFIAGDYVIQTYNGTERVASPALFGANRDAGAPWLVHEPFGKYSYRRGYARSAWYAWLGSNWGQRDRYRMSEKVGIGAALAYVPHGDTKGAEEFRDDVANLKSGGVVVCEQLEPDGPGGGLKYDVKPFEWNAGNTSAVADAATSAAHADLTILFLGHATQAESSGGASHDLANVGADIRSDITDRDAEAESATLEDQLVARWAAANYGDPELAPKREVVTDPPARDKARAEAAQLMAQALDGLDKHGVDTVRLCEEMRWPMKPPGKGPLVQVPGAPEQGNAPPAQPNDTPAQPEADPAQENA